MALPMFEACEATVPHPEHLWMAAVGGGTVRRCEGVPTEPEPEPEPEPVAAMVHTEWCVVDHDDGLCRAVRTSAEKPLPRPDPMPLPVWPSLAQQFRLELAKVLARQVKGVPVTEELRYAAAWVDWVAGGSEREDLELRQAECLRLGAALATVREELGQMRAVHVETRKERDHAQAELAEAREAFRKVEHAHSGVIAQIEALSAEAHRRTRSVAIAQANADKWRDRAYRALALLRSGEVDSLIDTPEGGGVQELRDRLIAILTGEGEAEPDA